MSAIVVGRIGEYIAGAFEMPISNGHLSTSWLTSSPLGSKNVALSSELHHITPTAPIECNGILEWGATNDCPLLLTTILWLASIPTAEHFYPYRKLDNQPCREMATF